MKSPSPAAAGTPWRPGQYLPLEIRPGLAGRASRSGFRDSSRACGSRPLPSLPARTVRVRLERSRRQACQIADPAGQPARRGLWPDRATSTAPPGPPAPIPTRARTSSTGSYGTGQGVGFGRGARWRRSVALLTNSPAAPGHDPGAGRGVATAARQRWLTAKAHFGSIGDHLVATKSGTRTSRGAAAA